MPRFAMLRISQINDRESIAILKVEGKLRGPWVAVLERACRDSLGRLRLDLSAVTFVDHAGVELLRGLIARGVTLAACSALVVELLHREGR
jgi:anti-anti-sigma regulatory factor